MNPEQDSIPEGQIPEALPVPPEHETVELLRQLLDIQREQLMHLRVSAAAHDNNLRWRAFLARWEDAYPSLASGCRTALPIVERCYSSLLSQMIEQLVENGEDALDNDFSLQEFLDRYGMRLAQLGNVLHTLAPLAEAAGQNESARSH